MKYIIPFVAFMVVSAQSFAVEVPVCTKKGGKQGWLLPNGWFTVDKCKGKVVFCDAIGSRSEGWYSATTTSQPNLIGWDHCSQDYSRRPQCVNVGTRSEGWTTPDGGLIWDKCATKEALCLAIGSRSEGWYAVSMEVQSKKLLGWTNCSKAP